jgi:hypothetical protein
MSVFEMSDPDKHSPQAHRKSYNTEAIINRY